MELKSKNFTFSELNGERSNRTFMELKYYKDTYHSFCL